jgi:carbonic anhydrase/acetyltransferase-like protein (isoleucine patch superfamily)
MDCFIAENATLIGDVQLGQDCSVWFGCVLRADNDRITIGRGSNIQDLSVVHVDKGVPVSIGEFVTVGHRAIIHGCSVGDYTLIGMGAIVMNNARIGKYCIIGAGALITEGMIIPDYSLVLGIPGKIISSVSEQKQAANKKSAEGYIELAKKYRTGEYRTWQRQ